MAFIDYQDGTPIYEQIVNQFKNRIVKGVLSADEKLPSVRGLAMELSINPNTIQRAYTELERQGYIYSVKGRGNFVSGKGNLREQKQMEILERLEALVTEAEEAGIESRVLTDYIQQKGKKGEKR
ncbi:MAG: GntR family transcriptional regulator [Lachnospiraceae bacterium]|nr:GntR family transcriptional regulator [Lachnospiraceae bacterium]MDY4792683.1 GntR family transcriptional regulator [Pararoseburia sp.]